MIVRDPRLIDTNLSCVIKLAPTLLSRLPISNS